MSYTVIGALVIAADPEGKLKYHYQGAQIEYLSDEDAERFLDDGLVVDNDEPKALDVGDDDPPAGVDGDKPPKTASKDAWVEYAVAKGMSREEAEEATRADLIQALG